MTTQTAPNPRAAARGLRAHIHDDNPSSPTDGALDQIDQLEELADVATLKLLAAGYEAMSAERMHAAALRDHGDRLLAARKSYAPIARAAASAAAELKRRGLRVWPGAGRSQPSASDLRAEGGRFLRLARHCADVLAGLDR